MFIAAKLNISLPTHFRKIAYKPQHRPYKPAGPDLQYMLRQSYDYLTIMPELGYDRLTTDVSFTKHLTKGARFS